ncbi:unnamed protein product [Malus baccata var. baccata]
MNFNLDGDVGETSSFKMDMPDFDFSSLPRKAPKTMERPQEEPSKGDRQGKQGPFKFAFDFNELDDSDLCSSLKKSEKSSCKNADSRKEVLSDKRGPQGSKFDLAEEISTLDGSSQTVAPPEVDASVVVSGKVNSINDDCPPKSRSENLELPHGPKSPERVLTKSHEDSDQQSLSSEKEMATEPSAKPATDDLSGRLVGGVDSNGGTVFEGENHGSLQITYFNTISRGKEDVDEKMSAGDGPNSEDSPLMDSSPVSIDSPDSNNGDGCKSGSDISTQNAESAMDDLDLEENSNAFVSRKTLHNIRSIKDDRNSTLKLPLSAESSESAVDKVTLTNESKGGEFHSKVSKKLEQVGSQMCQPSLIGASESAVDKVALTNESKRGEFHSKISERLEQAGSQMCQPSLIGAKYLSSGIKRIDTMRLRPAIEQGAVTNANDAQIGSKLPETPALVDKETKAKHVISGREDINSDSVPRKAKLVGNSRLSEKEATEREPALGSGTRKGLHDLRHVEISSSQANTSSSIEKTIKPSAQTRVNPKSMLSSLESMRNSKIITVEGSKLCPDKPAKKTTKLSTLNISKNIGGSKVSSNASRKTCGNFKEPSKVVVSEQVCIHESRVESKSNSTFDDHPTSGLGTPCAIYVMELDIPSVMETDGTVEEAEAYAMDKELEDVDSMVNECQYLRVATGHLRESRDEIVEQLRRYEGTTCLCFSFPGFALLAVDSRVTGPDMLTVSKISVVNSSLQTKICRCGHLYESFLLIQDKEGKIEQQRSHNGVVRACKDFNKHQKLSGGYSCYVCTGPGEAHLVYYNVGEDGATSHGSAKLGLGLHGMGSGAPVAMSELAYKLLGRRDGDGDGVVCDDRLGHYGVKGSEGLQVSEEEAIEAACGALYLAGLKSMKTGPPYEVHVFRRGGTNYERSVLLTDVCWKQWDMTKKLVCGKRNVAVFYSKALLRDNLWKMVTTKYPFVDVRRHGHPLALLEGGYVLHVVKLGSAGSIEKTMQHAATSSVTVLPEFMVENSDDIEMRVFGLSFIETMGERKRKVMTNVYIGRAGDNLLECLRESNH